MRKMLLTTIHQIEVKAIDEKDAPDTYAKNLPPGGKSKWQLIEYPDGKRLWHPVHSYTFNTSPVADHGKVKLEVEA